ncbi:MFS transporter [Paenibacillus cremeus]|uniref:MFS transporter n=1 Tax=Paenibacillus cremeus TaxID=2163881 RepID=A0A559JKA5_9BACL|nr:MFS transporter [Paenibacillus cremeus]TVY00295.1 MFS transporter [Paenibacillus cremeus]
MRAFLWTGYGSYFLIGLAYVIVGALLPEMLAYYGKDYDSGGQLVALQFFGFLIGVLTAPWWSKKLGKRGALQLCIGCLSAAELAFFTLPPWGVVLAIGPIAGFGFGMVETILGALVIQYLDEGQKTVTMTRLEVFFGIGALAMPLLASFFISTGWWRGSFLILGLISAGMLLLWLQLPMGKMSTLIGKPSSDEPGTDETSIESSAASGKASLGVLMLLFILMFALYVGTEMSVANFLPSILVENVKLKPELAALGATCFWGAMSVGRLFAAKLAGKTGFKAYLLFSCAGGCIVLGGFAMASSAAASFILITLLGLVMSGMFAILLVYANSFFPGLEERVTSVLIASGGIGGASIPLLTGWCMDQFTLQQTLGLLVVFYALMLVLMLLAARAVKARKTVAISMSDSRS